MKIYFNIPWATDKNIGQAYNDFMELLPSDDDFACFLDGDVMFLHPFFGKQLEQIVATHPECGLFTCMTNRVASHWQVNGEVKGDDIRDHRELAMKLMASFYLDCTPTPEPTTGHLLSGVLILIKKSMWKKIGGFKDGLLGVDNELHVSSYEAGEPFYLMKGVYVYHWYRGGNTRDKDHLLGVEKKSPKSALLEALEKRNRGVFKRGRGLVRYTKSRKIIYTAITGEYEMPIMQPAPPGWEFKFFTNSRAMKEKYPDSILIEEPISDVKLARKIKIMPWLYFDFDVCLWIDGNTTFVPQELENLEQHNFVISDHPERDCIYDEATAIINFKKDSAMIVDPIVMRYKSEGYPRNHGLFATHAILRKNTPEIRAFCEKWWHEVLHGSHRDQMSLNYLVWKYPIKIHHIKFGTIFKRQWLHRRNQN